MNHPTVSHRELQQQLAENPAGLYLVDVRSVAEHRASHLADCHLMPINRFNEKTVRHIKEAAGDRMVCFICQSGKRSAMAQGIWEQAGFNGAKSLEGGLKAWAQAGHALQKGEGGAISIERQVRIAAGALVVIGTLLGVFLAPGF